VAKRRSSSRSAAPQPELSLPSPCLLLSLPSPLLCCPVACQSSSCFYSALSLLQVCEHCNGRGNCSFASCLCSEGFATSSADGASAAFNASSSDCLTASCPRDCSGHGDCLADGSGGFGCACNDGFYGPDCSLGYCSSDCNAPYGSCNGSEAACTCAASPLGRYSGPQCLTFVASAAAGQHSTLHRLLQFSALLAVTLALQM
jgi:hypothetical protein